jgi:phenylacetate-CoA ligase
MEKHRVDRPRALVEDYMQQLSQAIPAHQRTFAWFVRNSVLPLGDRLYGQRMMNRLQFLRRAQWWSHEQLDIYRNTKLAELMQTIYAEVPFYRQLMDLAGVSPQDIRRPDDLHKLPVVTKDMLRAGYPTQTTRHTGQRTYEGHTSGSSGAPFCVKIDFYTLGRLRAAFLLALEWLGWEVGLPHVQMGMTLKRRQGRLLKDIMLRCYYVSAYDLTNEHLDAVLDYMDAHNTRFLWGYPGGIYYLARRASEKGWNKPLRGLATWGDTLYPHYRKTIEQAFRTRVYDQYGCAEGMMISAQCGHGSHFHVFSTDVIVEYLDDSSHPVPPGEVGNLIVTRLHPGPMPLVRYKVGDIGVSGGARHCECGRGFEITESIDGRDTDILLTPSGNRLIVHFFTGILEYFTEIDTFQVVQEEINSIKLYVVPRATFNDDVIRRIVGQLKEKGADLEILVEVVDQIPVGANGKRRFVINKLLTKPVQNLLP